MFRTQLLEQGTQADSQLQCELHTHARFHAYGWVLGCYMRNKRENHSQWGVFGLPICTLFVNVLQWYRSSHHAVLQLYIPLQSSWKRQKLTLGLLQWLVSIVFTHQCWLVTSLLFLPLIIFVGGVIWLCTWVTWF